MNNEADRIAEEDEARSVAVWRLLSSDCPPELGSSVQPSPSVLVQYWHDHSAMPADVAECIGTWMRLCRESGVRHLLFGDLSARSFISSELGPRYVAAFDRCGHPAMRSDYFRLCWMLMRGGLYVDADEWLLRTDCEMLFADDRLKLQPLCYDVQTDR